MSHHHVSLKGILTLPEITGPKKSIVVFAHGSGSGRYSPSITLAADDQRSPFISENVHSYPDNTKFLILGTDCYDYTGKCGVTHMNFVLTSVMLKNMKQIELTSKLVVALIAIVVFSAMTIPTLAQSALTIPNGFITSGMIRDGAVRTQDIADGAVTEPKIANNAVTSAKIADGTIQEQDIADGVIPDGGGGGAIQPTVHIVEGPSNTATGSFAISEADCPDGEILTGGGAATGNLPGEFTASFPADEDTWRAVRVASGDETVRAFAVCLDFSP